jgi:hypothetical protein
MPGTNRGTVGEHGIKKSQRPRRKKLDEMNAVTRLLQTITRRTGMGTQAHTDPDYVPDVEEIIEEVLVTCYRQFRHAPETRNRKPPYSGGGISAIWIGTVRT